MVVDELNLRHLRAFVKTCELGTLLAAARAVHLSQPALTQGLKRLEDRLETSLFDRHSDGMQPTEAAQRILPRIRTALDRIRSTRVTQTQVRAFVTLARTGSYSAASSVSGLASASLHRAVRDLEAALGQQLVARKGRAVKLTNAGRSAARRFRLAYADLSAAIEELDHFRGASGPRLAVGAMPLCRARVLPAAIVAFRREHAASCIMVAEGSYAELIEPLRDGELDFLIGALRSPGPEPDLRQWALFEDRPAVIARSGHPLAKPGDVELTELAAFEWCLPPRGVPLRERWHLMFEHAGIAPPAVRVECGSALTIRQILRDSNCLTVLSRDQVALELEAGWLTVIAPTPASQQRTIGITCRADWHPTPLQRDFLAVLENRAAQA